MMRSTSQKAISRKNTKVLCKYASNDCVVAVSADDKSPFPMKCFSFVVIHEK